MIDGGGEGVVALYAAKADETAPERPMPYGDSGGKNYGVLTFTLCKLLLDQTAEQNASPLTYRELGQRIQAQYVAWGRLNGPTPFVDAATGDIDREVLGSRLHVGRSRIVLASDPIHGWTINVGRMHGVTKDSILAVYPIRFRTAVAKDPRIRGSDGEPRFRGKRGAGAIRRNPAAGVSAQTGPLRLVKLDLGELRIPVAIDAGIPGKADTAKGARTAPTLSKPQLARLRELEAGLKARAERARRTLSDCPHAGGRELGTALPWQ